MSVNSQCPICGIGARLITADHGNQERWDCDRCGKFNVPGQSAKAALKRLSDHQPAVLSGWVFERNQERSVPELSKEVIERAASRSLPPLAERMDRLLLEAARGNKRLGQPTDFRAKHLVAASYSLDEQELKWLVDALTDQGLLKFVQINSTRKITRNGYHRIDKLSRQVRPSGKAFVAMWFNEEMNEAFDKGLAKGIHDAGFDPVRVDETEHIDRIDDKIIALIRESAFVVADFTGHRGGVYFEAGFALGLGLPVIWTCRKSDMDGLHFDIRRTMRLTGMIRRIWPGG